MVRLRSILGIGAVAALVAACSAAPTAPALHQSVDATAGTSSGEMPADSTDSRNGGHGYGSGN